MGDTQIAVHLISTLNPKPGLTFHDDDLKAAIEADTGIRPSFALEAFADLDADVRQSIARIKASPFIPNKDSIRGFVYEVETGRLREVKE